MTPVLVATLIGAAVALALGLLALRVQAGVIRRLRQQRDAIETEEHRMFAFLHGLGEALSREGAAETAVLHRTIVRGTAMVVDAHGAALYLLDEAGERLVPSYQSEACPPLVPVPDHIAEQARRTPNTLESYRRLTGVGRDWGPFGEALSTGRNRRVNDFATHPAYQSAHAATHEGTSALIAPLIYNGEPLGVLAVANAGGARPFGDNDVDVFQNIAEQSAFALGNAIVHQQAAEKHLLDQELATASEVQRILLPDASPDLEGYEIAGTNIAAKTVSGDYFDFFPVDDGDETTRHLGVVIADVSGKGVPASLIMAMCRSVVRTHAAATPSPAEVLVDANRQLFPDIRHDMFISLAYAVLQGGNGKVQLARAGHDPPLLYRASEGTVSPLESPGMAIGLDGGNAFARVTRDLSLELQPGDIMLFYTDGVNEAADVHGDEFGLERLHRVLCDSAHLGAPEIVAEIRSAVQGFAGDVPQADDITLIAVKKT